VFKVINLVRIGSRSPLCSFNDALCDELRHFVEMREVPKRTTSLIKRGAGSARFVRQALCPFDRLQGINQRDSTLGHSGAFQSTESATGDALNKTMSGLGASVIEALFRRLCECHLPGLPSLQRGAAVWQQSPNASFASVVSQSALRKSFAAQDGLRRTQIEYNESAYRPNSRHTSGHRLAPLWATSGQQPLSERTFLRRTWTRSRAAR
jgi:hypothetical protein